MKKDFSEILGVVIGGLIICASLWVGGTVNSNVIMIVGLIIGLAFIPWGMPIVYFTFFPAKYSMKLEQSRIEKQQMDSDGTPQLGTKWWEFWILVLSWISPGLSLLSAPAVVPLIPKLLTVGRTRPDTSLVAYAYVVLLICTYISVPIGIVIGSGLRRRKPWGWRLNWYYLAAFSILFTVSRILPNAMKPGYHDSFADGASAVIVVGLFLLANYRYWMRRRMLFQPEKYYVELEQERIEKQRIENERLQEEQREREWAEREAFENEERKREESNKHSSYENVGGSLDWCYLILGVPTGASWATIDKAYKAKAKLHHPDHEGDHDIMVTLNEARETLRKLHKP